MYSKTNSEDSNNINQNSSTQTYDIIRNSILTG